MSLSANQLSFSYERKVPILKGISFEVKRGEFIGIFGPNGGGKTTLLKLLLGLLSPSSGSVNVDGKVGYVPQVRRFDKQFPITVFEVVLQGLLSLHKGWGGFSKQQKVMAHEALKKVGLEEKANAPFGTLSGGQIQRTLIARALAPCPEILLLDEATVGVDPEALSEILDFLTGLKGEITILMVTHDLQAIAEEMDTLFCINRDLTRFTPEKVCEHFAMGLYHPTLLKREDPDA